MARSAARGMEPKSPIWTIAKLARVVTTQTLESNSPCHHRPGDGIRAWPAISHVRDGSPRYGAPGPAPAQGRFEAPGELPHPTRLLQPRRPEDAGTSAAVLRRRSSACLSWALRRRQRGLELFYACFLRDSALFDLKCGGLW